jgi:hypothetical protein
MTNQTVVVKFIDEETYTEQQGVILNSAYCPVRGTFMLLISCDNDTLKTIRADSLGLQSSWIDDTPSFVFVNSGNDDDSSDEGEDESYD